MLNFNKFFEPFKSVAERIRWGVKIPTFSEKLFNLILRENPKTPLKFSVHTKIYENPLKKFLDTPLMNLLHDVDKNYVPRHIHVPLNILRTFLQ